MKIVGDHLPSAALLLSLSPAAARVAVAVADVLDVFDVSLSRLLMGLTVLVLVVVVKIVVVIVVAVAIVATEIISSAFSKFCLVFAGILSSAAAPRFL